MARIPLYGTLPFRLNGSRETERERGKGRVGDKERMRPNKLHVSFINTFAPRRHSSNVSLQVSVINW